MTVGTKAPVRHHEFGVEFVEAAFAYGDGER